jgi:two-component system response regulator
LNLPKVHGLEVLRCLRANPLTKMLPVVIFTSSIEERDVAAAYQLGANSYIQKSIDFDEFSESIRRVSQYWGVLNTFLPA